MSTLAIQLGIPVSSLVKSDPTLESIKVSTSMELKLEAIDQVATINKVLNTTYDGLENCANLAAACSNTELYYQYDPLFGGGGGNTEVFAENLKDKSLYESVPENKTKIASVIHYKLDDSYITDQINEAQKIIDKSDAEVKANPKLLGFTPEEAKKLKDEAKANAQDDVKKERHFSVVILKDKTGKKVQQIIQKAGNTPFNHQVVPAKDSRVNLPYSPKPVKGTKNATYNKKG